MNRVSVIRLLLALLFFSTTACSSIAGKSPGPELGALLIRVSADYVKHVVNADEARIGGSILWTDFLKQADIDKQEYLRQVRSLQNRWTAEEHPLLGLKVEELKWYGDEATVYLRKASKNKKYPMIKIEMIWSGSGWLVTKDNLFGKKLLVADWAADRNAFKS